jgi:hypothetical protein
MMMKRKKEVSESRDTSICGAGSQSVNILLTQVVAIYYILWPSWARNVSHAIAHPGQILVFVDFFTIRSFRALKVGGMLGFGIEKLKLEACTFGDSIFWLSSQWN